MQKQMYVEIRTARNDGSEVIVRERVANARVGLISMLKTMTEGWYYARNQYSVLIFAEPVEKDAGWVMSDLFFPNGIMTDNDFGEQTLFCLREYGERAQVSEGTFYA